MGHSIDHPIPAPPASLADLDGTNGFTVHGLAPTELLGSGAGGSGDVNGDGLDDLLVSAPLHDPNGITDAGESYVIFGKAGGFTALFDQTTLDGGNGFRISGLTEGDISGVSMANAGDVDGDGLADVIIGAGADADGKIDAGSSYVVFGSDQGWLPSVDLATLDDHTGFRIDGAAPGDFAGRFVDRAGDVNGDGFDDMIITSPTTSLSDFYQHYVVFGSGQGFPPSLDLASLDGNNGFRIGESGYPSPAAGAGDVNGDGFDDIVVTRSSSTCDMFLGCSSQRAVNVVFGTNQGFPANLDLATIDGTNGFAITGTINSAFGEAVSGAGDFNGDGLADLMIGNFRAPEVNNLDTGHVYVIFGTTQGFPAKLDVATLNGVNGFRIDGAANDYLGYSINSDTDLNGDGFDDLVAITHPLSGSHIHGVYGNARIQPSVVDITTLDGSQGFRADSNEGRFVEAKDAGDLNGDGFGDAVIADPFGWPDGLAAAGRVSAVFGDDFTASVTHAGGATDDTLVGTAGGDAMVGGLGDDLLRGNGGPDVLKGGAGDDMLVVSDGGFQRVDGGGGRDRLKVDGFDLDLTATPDLRVRDIEIVDLGDASANQVTLALRDLRTMSDTSNTITITGDAGDKVVIDLTGTGFQPIDRGNGFIEYTAQSADNGLTLMVQDSLDLSGIIF